MVTGKHSIDFGQRSTSTCAVDIPNRLAQNHLGNISPGTGALVILNDVGTGSILTSWMYVRVFKFICIVTVALDDICSFECVRSVQWDPTTWQSGQRQQIDCDRIVHVSALYWCLVALTH